MEISLRPNLSKVLLWLLLQAFVVSAAIIGGMWGFNSISGGVLETLLEEFDVTLSTGTVVLYSLVAFGVIMLVFTAINMSVIGGQSIKVTDSGLEVDKRPLSFDNVARVTFDNSGLSDTVLSKGKVVFELTGVNRDKVSQDFVDNPKEITGQIHHAVNTYRMRRYSNFAREEKIDNIMEKF
jgi:hypothetical protein